MFRKVCEERLLSTVSLATIVNVRRFVYWWKLVLELKMSTK